MQKENQPSSVVISQRLDNPQIKQKIIDIFCRYYDDLLPVLVVAVAESDGIRPEGLSNEVYACFHHMARALCEEDSSPLPELDSANKSHIKRAILDSYKIAIHSYLEEASQAKELLDYMVLVKEFKDYLPDGIDNASKVKTISKEVKKSYKKAKTAEMIGQLDVAITEFDNTLKLCTDLRESLDIFTSDRTYILACEREAQRKVERTKDRRISIWVPIIVALLSPVITLMIARYCGTLDKKQDPPAVQKAPDSASVDKGNVNKSH